MKNLVEKFIVVTASSALGLVILNSTPTQAAQVQFSGKVDSGSLINTTYSGFFTYDESSALGSGEEFLAIQNLEFNFLDNLFTQVNDISPFGPEVAFTNGKLLGLSFSGNANVGNTNISFSFIPGFDEVSQAFFAYDTSTGNGGIGNVTFRNAQNVPEPSTLVATGLALVSAGLCTNKKDSKRNKKDSKRSKNAEV